MKIQIELKSSYGTMRAYPLCPMAKGLAELANAKTLTLSACRTILGMGFAIEEMHKGVTIRIHNPGKVGTLPAID